MKNFIGLAVALALAGCATTYGGMGLTGGVKADHQADGTWLVLASGNGYATVEAMADFTFLRAAEITKEQGANCFEIVSQYAAMEDTSMGSQYGTMNFKKPDARLRFRIPENLQTCDDNANAEKLIARLAPKVKNPRSYKRED
jgi:hypothetical protein